ncbi:MAG: DNA cytosine methyltransferase [Muribaculaceae bacterium]|nr:DNA cytosine methyltransferase [Muribaculaceae bacterium]
MINLLYIDLFCGAGGTSTGVNTARLDGEQCAKVVACVNHDANAIASHVSNHPEAMHFTEDIRTLDLTPLVDHLKECRAENPEALTVLWASLECTNFSRAKGGQPRDADSRTLAEHLFRYIEEIQPDYIQIENVEEFMSWGDVDENGKPISMDRGRCYLRWVRNVKRYGYNFEHRILNAADYGAYTSRKRFFGIFARKGLPIIFPEATHSKNAEKSLFDDMQKWRPVREVLDFENEGESIFGRKKPLSEKTLERIYAGLIKYVAGGKEAFIIKYNSVNKKTGKYCPPSLDDPCPTVACQNRLAFAKVSFLSKQYSGCPYDKNMSVDAPAGTVTTVDHHAFVTVHYGNGYNLPLSSPAPTLTTKDKLSIVKPCFLDNQYGNGKPTSIESVSGCLTTNPKQKLVTCDRFLMNPQFGSVGSSVENPCFTLIARMDKRPPYLIITETGGVEIQIFADDSPMMVKIKEFMALHCVVDIKMRMLTVVELLLIQGFPRDYILIGTQAEQKKYIGNAVEVTIARKLCEALCSGIRDFDLNKYYTKQVA